MDNLRPLLYLSLLFIIFMIWQAWQKDHAPVKPVISHHVQQSITQASQPSPEKRGPAGASEKETRKSILHMANRYVEVKTKVLNLLINAKTGAIMQASLPTYPVSTKEPKKPFQIFFKNENETYVAYSGLIPSGQNPYLLNVLNTKNFKPNIVKVYALEKGEKILRVPLTIKSLDHLQWKRTYIFKPDSFEVHIKDEVINSGKLPWRGSLFNMIVRTPVKSSHSLLNADDHSYIGPAWYNGSYKKISFSDILKNPVAKTVKGGWVAMVEQYFLTAWIPPKNVPVQIMTRSFNTEQGQMAGIAYVSPTMSLAPGNKKDYSSKMWVGPELQGKLASVAPGLDRTTGYGYFTFIAQPLYWLLSKIHSIIGNWGWSIVLLTVLIKLVFYKLSETSYRSMARMRSMQPKLKELKERYADDRQKMSQATMEIYKKEKINPLGGCLPMLVQVPVFISLYWVLLKSVELRQAPFMFWIHNLAAPDPYFVLPVLMGITMFLQQRLNPMSVDPLQQKVMMALPIAFSIFFAFFPSGLVLYWLTNNILSIAQQWVITRNVQNTMKTT